MSKCVRDILSGRQRGFTLIELMAVMAILAILVAVVAPAVTGSRDASIRARVQADAKQVYTAAADYYGRQNEAETTTPQTVTVGAISATDIEQRISNRWPEKFITDETDGGTGLYETEFEPIDAPVDVRIVSLGDDVTAEEFLKMTAIDLQALETAGLLEKLPEGSELTTDFTGITVVAGKDPSASVKIHNFLWLFEKASSGSNVADDIRRVAVFQLDSTKIIEAPAVAEGAFAVELTYKRIL